MGKSSVVEEPGNYAVTVSLDCETDAGT